VKILIVGESSVGKSSVMFRFVYDKFNGEIKPTYGCDFLSKMIEKEGKIYKTLLWDTAGQESNFKKLIFSRI
jgi:small GTP-binding protein